VGVFDPDIIVERGCITKPGNIRESQVSSHLVNLEEVIGNSDR
jgi:hypothetical protein